MLDGSRALSNGRWRVHEWTRGGEEGLDTFYKTVRKTSEQVVQTDRLLVQPNPFTITMQTGNTNKKSFSKKAEALSSPYFFVHKRLYLVLRLRRNKKKDPHLLIAVFHFKSQKPFRNRSCYGFQTVIWASNGGMVAHMAEFLQSGWRNSKKQLISCRELLPPSVRSATDVQQKAACPEKTRCYGWWCCFLQHNTEWKCWHLHTLSFYCVHMRVQLKICGLSNQGGVQVPSMSESLLHVKQAPSGCRKK